MLVIGVSHFVGGTFAVSDIHQRSSDAVLSFLLFIHSKLVCHPKENLERVILNIA